MKHFSKKLPWLLGGTLIAAYLLYGFWPKPILVDTVKVTRGALTVTIDDDGETRIREKFLMTAPVTGKLLRLQLHPGDLVERNKTELMRILPVDPTLLDTRSQAESEARVQAADAAYEESKASLASAEESAELAKNHYDRAVKLHNSNSISQAEFDDAEYQHRIAQAILRSLGSRVKVRLYEKELARAAFLRVSDSKDGGNSAAMKILSPIDGRVLRVLHEDSSVVTAGTAILELGDPQDVELRIDVLSIYAVGIEPGSRVFIENWGGDYRLHGIVRVVEPSAFLKISALGVEEKRVNVIVDFVEPWDQRKNLGDGFRVETRIVARSTSEDSLKVASGAVFRQGQAWHVFRIRNGRADLVTVKVGETNGQETEVREGLKEGEMVILHPSDQIRHGVSIKEAD